MRCSSLVIDGDHPWFLKGFGVCDEVKYMNMKYEVLGVEYYRRVVFHVQLKTEIRFKIGRGRVRYLIWSSVGLGDEKGRFPPPPLWPSIGNKTPTIMASFSENA
jgi:hypothetical protein